MAGADDTSPEGRASSSELEEKTTSTDCPPLCAFAGGASSSGGSVFGTRRTPSTGDAAAPGVAPAGAGVSNDTPAGVGVAAGRVASQNGSIAARSSATELNRSSGFGPIARWMAAASSAGRCGRQIEQLGDVAREVRRRDLMRLVAPDRPASREHLEDHHAEREDVGARVDRVRRVRLLRRHVLGRAHDHAGPREPAIELAGDLQLRDAEVEQLEQRLAPCVPRAIMTLSGLRSR
ncbi:MAG: hypothetical protein V9G15_06115 [Dermatophilaceae bacterium]